jgi:DNA-directed RNA polymerase subunit M/transcription elongation factor TFIIS
MAGTNQPGRIACPHCAAMIKSPALAAGAMVSCPKCGKAFRLGGEGDSREVQGPKSKVQGQGAGRQVEVERGGAGEGERLRRRTLNEEARERQGAPPDTAGQASSGTQAAVPPPAPVAGVSQGSKVDAERPGVRSHAERGNEEAGERRARPADKLVDPNLLPPPPPRVQPKATQVKIICSLCGTRLYAAIEKIGETIRCPDCHTVNEIVGPKEAAPKKDQGPTLDGAEDFGLSDPGKRPAYRPLVQPRGEYAVLGALDPAHVDHGWTLPPGMAPPGKARGTRPPADPEARAETGDDEIRLEAPAERVQLAPPPAPTLPDEPPDPEEALHDGRYDDNLIGDNVDGRQPDAWKKAPFVFGLLEFLVYPSTLMRLCAYAVGLGLLVNVGQFTIEAAMAEGAGMLAAPIILPVFIFCAAVWTFPFCAAWLAIVQGTANGEKEVNAWPDWNMAEWIGSALYVPVALFLTGLPGILIAAVMAAGGAEFQSHGAWLAAPILFSWLLFFPPAIYSMLAEVSILAVVSPAMWRSLETAKDGWMLFYIYSFGILLFGGLAAAVAIVGHPVVAAIGAVGLVVLAFLYARLLGRLMWYASAEEARREAVAARRAAFAARYSRIGKTQPPSPPSEQPLHQSPA